MAIRLYGFVPSSVLKLNLIFLFFNVFVDLILLLILKMPLFHAFTNDAINYGCPSVQLSVLVFFKFLAFFLEASSSALDLWHGKVAAVLNVLMWQLYASFTLWLLFLFFGCKSCDLIIFINL